MRPNVRHQVWIAVTAVAVLFTNLGATRLWDQDEAFFARTAVEMHERSEWIVPYFNGEVFAHKPPLMFWLMQAGYLLFGMNEFAARFWSAAFGVFTALLAYRIGRRMFSARVGLIAGLAISTSLMFDVVARAATPDSFLVFFSTLALWLFVKHETWSDESATIDLAVAPPLPWQTCAAMYSMMALAVLVKGPIGLLLPGGTIGLYLLVRGKASTADHGVDPPDRILLFLRRITPARIARTIWAMRPVTALAAVLLIAGPWFAAVGWRTHGAFLGEFFGVQNFGRFVGAMDNHGGGIWYYMPAVLIGFFPWSIFAVPTLVDLIRRCRGKLPRCDGARLLCCWIVVYVGFFSIAATKLPNYVLPAYPALALATACFLDRWLAQPECLSRWWPRLAFGALVLIGLMAAVAPVALFHGESGLRRIENLGIAPELQRDLLSTAWLGALLLSAGVAGLVFSWLRQSARALATLTFAATGLSILLFGWLAVRIDRLQPCPAVAEAIHEHATGMPQVAQFGYFRPSLVYYTDTRVETCRNAQRVADFLSGENAFLVTTEDHFARLAAHLPGDVAVIERLPEFPRRGAVLILSHGNRVAARESQSTQ